MNEKTAKGRAKDAKADLVVDTIAPDDEFYKLVLDDTKRLALNSNVVINIPVWGFPGHGKTSSILTEIHYSKANVHGAALALVTDSEDIEDVCESYPGYSASDLVSIADSTRAYLTDMKERFFGQNEWPDATEQPAQYLLEIQGPSGLLGFVVIPDIRGGSFEEADSISKNALANAHAMIVVVRSSDYVDVDSPRAADYRKDVTRRIQRCAKAMIPTVIMLTMSDEYGKSGDPADQAEKELTNLVSFQSDAFKAVSKILRVSAVGLEGDHRKKPPDARLRKPDKLIEGWTWAIHQALKQPREPVVARVPSIDLRADPETRRLTTVPLPTLRTIAELNGAFLSIVASASESDLFFAATNSGVCEIAFSSKDDQLNIVREVNVKEQHGSHLKYSDGFLFLEGATPQKIWHGPRQGPLIPTLLPIPVQSWSPVSSNQLIAIVADGSLHLLRLDGDVWQDLHHLPAVFVPSSTAVSAYLPAEGLALAIDGNEVFGAVVQSNSRFGETRRPVIGAKFDLSCSLNTDGYFVSTNSDSAIWAGREKAIVLGKSRLEPLPSIAPAAAMVSWVSPANKLRAASLVGRRIISPDAGPEVAADVDVICMNSAGNLILMASATAISAVKVFGFS